LGLLVEHGRDTPKSDNEGAELFFDSLREAMRGAEFDNESFAEEVGYFLQMIREDRLQIRKTLEPNHAKLYIFNLKEEHKLLKERIFITGSSNLTKAGLINQREFNVEIGDYGTEAAEKFFDELWEDAIEITEVKDLKSRLLQIFTDETLVAEVTPYEAYALVVQKYAQLQEEKEVPASALDVLEEAGYTPFRYQLDAVRQGLSILETHNGVIVADVVGLGKSIIASLLGKSLGQRGMVICPPGLIGDKNMSSGWRKYVNDFKLERWEVRSCGDLELIAEFVSEQGRDIETVVIDEAHRFRNQDSKHYELLSRICRNRKVILLTATPFNNSPGDIFSLLKLFTIPGKSTLTLTDDLDLRFAVYRSIFRRLSYIRKNYNSPDPQKRARAEAEYATFLRRNLHHTQGDRSFNTEGELEIPEAALEELLVNMLVHRNYFISAPHKLFIFDSRVEIVSPGCLPNSLTVEQVKSGSSIPRNPILHGLASRISPYRGIATGIRRALRLYPRIEIENSIERNELRIVLTRTREGG